VADRAIGGREVAVVAALAVATVLGAAILTSVLPVDLQRVVFHTPLLILVLVVATGGLLWRIATRRPPDG
jgi:FtsH-binding integral membrane protein